MYRPRVFPVFLHKFRTFLQLGPCTDSCQGCPPHPSWRPEWGKGWVPLPSPVGNPPTCPTINVLRTWQILPCTIHPKLQTLHSSSSAWYILHGIPDLSCPGTRRIQHWPASLAMPELGYCCKGRPWYFRGILLVVARK